MSRIKQVILVRRDLKMRRGKEIAQGSHASMEFLVHEIRVSDEVKLNLSEIELSWLRHGMGKVCLQVNSEAELIEHHERALAAGLKSYVILDSGKAEFDGKPTLTACAIGPDDAERIDAITGKLAFY